MKKKLLVLMVILSLIFTTLTGCNSGDAFGETQRTQDESIDFNATANDKTSTSTAPVFKENPADDFEYEYNASVDGIEIIKYIGTGTEVRVPEKIWEQPVKTIGDKAFWGSGINEVFIPDSVTKIGSGAISNCPNLTNIHFEGPMRAGIIIQLDGYLWRVIDVQDDKALVISEDIIENMIYNTGSRSITWENSSMRQYLNVDFYSTLSADTQARIIETPVTNNDNPRYGTYGGNDTHDKIFLLSADEAKEYFANDSERVAYNADGSALRWWLRTSGDISRLIACITSGSGVVVFGGCNVRDNSGNLIEYSGVRPALWLSL